MFKLAGASCYMNTEAEKCNIRVEFVSISVGDKFSTIGEIPTKIQQVQQAKTFNYGIEIHS